MSEEKKGEDSKELTRSVGGVGIAIVMSRVLGLVREQVFAYLFGAGLQTDSFIAAFRISNLLRSVTAEGAVSAGLIPVYNDLSAREGEERARRLGRALLGFILIVVGVICIVGIFFSPYLVMVIAPGFHHDPEKFILTVSLTRYLFPFLLFLSLAAWAMGILNSNGRFFIPALSSIGLNVGMILGGVLGYSFFSPPIYAMALGALAGGLAQFLIQVPVLWSIKFPVMPQWMFWKDPELWRVMKLVGPVVIGSAAIQINIAVNTIIASFSIEGAVSYLNYGYRLMYLPQGMFGVAMATVLLPSMSRTASRKDFTALRDQISYGLRMVLFFTIPASVGLILLSTPIVGLLFQHGEFNALDTLRTARALSCYTLGLFAYAGIRVYSSAFYALHDTKTPFIIGSIMVLVNLILNLLFLMPLGFLGIALATSLTAVLNLALLFHYLRKKIGFTGGGEVFSALKQQLISALAMSVFILLMNHFFFTPDFSVFQSHLAGLGLQIGLTIPLSIAIYFLAAYLQGGREIKEIISSIRFKVE